MSILLHFRWKFVHTHTYIVVVIVPMVLQTGQCYRRYWYLHSIVRNVGCILWDKVFKYVFDEQHLIYFLGKSKGEVKFSFSIGMLCYFLHLWRGTITVSRIFFFLGYCKKKTTHKRGKYRVWTLRSIREQAFVNARDGVYLYIYLFVVFCVRASNINSILNAYQTICRTPQRYSFIQLNKFYHSGVRWLFFLHSHFIISFHFYFALYIRLQARAVTGSLVRFKVSSSHGWYELFGIDLKHNNMYYAHTLQMNGYHIIQVSWWIEGHHIAEDQQFAYSHTHTHIKSMASTSTNATFNSSTP